MSQYTMEELWSQAKTDALAAYVTDGDSEAYILHGIKFEKRDGNYKLLKATSDYYPEVLPHFYNYFTSSGYRAGLCEVMMLRIEEQLESVERRIQKEMNEAKPNQQNIDYAKSTRSNLMDKYNKFRNELNQSINNQS